MSITLARLGTGILVWLGDYVQNGSFVFGSAAAALEARRVLESANYGSLVQRTLAFNEGGVSTARGSFTRVGKKLLIRRHSGHSVDE